MLLTVWLVIWCYSSLSPVLWSVRSVSDWLFDVTVHCLLCCDRSDQFLTGYLMLRFTVSYAVIGQISFWLVIWCYSSLSPVLWSVRSVSDWLFDVTVQSPVLWLVRSVSDCFFDATVHCLLCYDWSDQFLTGFLMLQFTVSCVMIGQISFWLVFWCYSSLSPVLWLVRSVSSQRLVVVLKAFLVIGWQLLKETTMTQFHSFPYYYYHWSLLYSTALCSQADLLYFKCCWRMLGYFSVSVTHWTLTWTARSLTCI